MNTDLKVCDDFTVIIREQLSLADKHVHSAEMYQSPV